MYLLACVPTKLYEPDSCREQLAAGSQGLSESEKDEIFRMHSENISQLDRGLAYGKLLQMKVLDEKLKKRKSSNAEKQQKKQLKVRLPT